MIIGCKLRLMIKIFIKNLNNLIYQFILSYFFLKFVKINKKHNISNNLFYYILFYQYKIVILYFFRQEFDNSILYFITLITPHIKIKNKCLKDKIIIQLFIIIII